MSALAAMLKNAFSVEIPAELPGWLRVIFVLLTAVHIVGGVFFALKAMQGPLDTVWQINLYLYLLSAPISFCFIGFPGVINGYPPMVVKIIGQSFLRRFLFELKLVIGSA